MSPIAIDGRFSIRVTIALALRLVSRAWGRLVVLVVGQTLALGVLTVLLALLLAPVSTLLAKGTEFLVQQVVVGFTTGAVVTVCFAVSEGRPCGLGEALAAAGRRLGPMAVLCFLQTAATGIGFLLLVVPGVVIIVLLAAAAPACMIERIGIFESFSRSTALTRGHRWRLLGLFALFGLVGMLGFGGVVAAAFHPDALTILLAVLGGIALVAFFLMALVLPTAIYVALRDAAPRAELGMPLPGAL